MAQHQVERELQSATPRKLRDRNGIGCGLAFARLFMLPHTLAGLALVGIAIVRTFLWLAVVIGGAQSNGIVADMRVLKGKTTTHLVTYSYEADGRMFQDEVDVGEDAYRRIKRGDAVPVGFVNWAPFQSRWPSIPGFTPAWELTKLWLAAVLWNAILSVFLWHLYAVPWMQRRLLRWGTPTAATIASVRRSTVRTFAGDWVVCFEYTAVDNAGTCRTFRDSTRIDKARANKVKPGDRVTLLYDPTKPNWNVVYLFASYQIVGGFT